MAKVKQNCGNCKWAKWEHGPRGGRLPNKTGECAYPPIMIPLLPEANRTNNTRDVAYLLNNRRQMWADEGTQCLVWAKKDTEGE